MIDARHMGHQHRAERCAVRGLIMMQKLGLHLGHVDIRRAFGLAPFEMASDPTLRPGDIVVTKDGLMAYTGKPGPAGEFTPVDPASIGARLNSVTSPPQISRPAEPPAPRFFLCVCVILIPTGCR